MARLSNQNNKKEIDIGPTWFQTSGMALEKSQEWLRERVEDSPDGCWLWTGARTKKGYANCGNGTKWECVHRVSWRAFKGLIPRGLHVLHRCDVRHCINPEHLFLGTNRDNVQDMWTKGRARVVKRCKLTAENVRQILDSPENNSVLARRFGVTPPAIRAIRIGKTWKEVPR